MKVKELIILLQSLDQEEPIYLPVDEEYMNAGAAPRVRHSKELYAYSSGIIPYTYNDPLAITVGEDTGLVGYLLG